MATKSDRPKCEHCGRRIRWYDKDGCWLGHRKTCRLYACDTRKLPSGIPKKLPTRRPAKFARWSLAYGLSVPIQLLYDGDVVLVLRAVAGQNPLAEEIVDAMNRARVVLPGKVRR